MERRVLCPRLSEMTSELTTMSSLCSSLRAFACGVCPAHIVSPFPTKMLPLQTKRPSLTFYLNRFLSHYSWAWAQHLLFPNISQNLFLLFYSISLSIFCPHLLPIKYLFHECRDGWACLLLQPQIPAYRRSLANIYGMNECSSPISSYSPL